VALYDHSKTTAALAVALWRYHADQKDHDPEAIREQLRAQWDRERESDPLAKKAWEDEKFLLIQGDFFGIQDFIFATGGQTQKKAAKLLRGRSFYVSLLTELAALKILETLGIPATSQVTNAAGKFLIVAPNTPEVLTKLDAVQAEFDQWFLAHSFGQSGIGIASLPARCDDFRTGKEGEPSPFSNLIDRLFKALETAKLRRFNLCAQPRESAVFAGFLERFQKGECQIDGRSPAEVQENGVWMSQLAADQIDTGHYLANQQRVLITEKGLNGNTLRLAIFGYHVSFTAGEDETGRFGREAKTGNLRRAWDFSLPLEHRHLAGNAGENADAPSADEVLWNGYARRQINGYVPRFRAADLSEAEQGKYDGLVPQPL
jgi:CRISPR-associated protein Csm1